MERKTKEEVLVRFKSNSKKYSIWIGRNGKIAIDKKYKWILEENKLRNVDEKIFIIMDVLKNRDFDIRDIKRCIGISLYNKLNLEKSDIIRRKRKADNFSVRGMIDANGNSMSVRLYSSDYDRIMNKVMTDIIGLNITEILLVRTTRSIIELMSKYINSGLDSVGFKNFNFPVDIKVSLIPNNDIPNIKVDTVDRYINLGSKPFRYTKHSYEISVNKFWYYSIYLKNKHVITKDGKRFIVMKIEDRKSSSIYYVMNNSSGYSINVKRLTLKKNGF